MYMPAKIHKCACERIHTGINMGFLPNTNSSISFGNSPIDELPGRITSGFNALLYTQSNLQGVHLAKLVWQPITITRMEHLLSTSIVLC